MKWSTLAEKVHQSLSRNSLLKENDKILVAISGGADSVVMLHILYELRDRWNWELIAGHIDHGLRPEEDDNESLFCKKLAEDLSLQYVERKIDLNDIQIRQDYSINSTQNPSLESLARDMRYKIYDEWCRDLGCNAVCTGHHAGDQAETIIYRMLTGSGIDGLKGIPSIRVNIVRPLLSVAKKEILSYAVNGNIGFCEDSSNRNTQFKRNKIRHEILPHLHQAGFENYESSLASSAKSLDEASEALNYYLEKEIKNTISFKEHISIDLAKFLPLPVFIKKQIIRKVFSEYLDIKKHISNDQLEQVLYFAEKSETGSRLELYGYFAIKERQNVVWSIKEKQSIYKIMVCKEGQNQVGFDSVLIEIIDHAPDQKLVSRDHLTEYFSIDLYDQEINIRNWIPGDTMTLFGKGKIKKISNILKDEKVNALNKQDYPVISKKNDIIWIPGVKRSNLYKVETKDKKMIKITYKYGAKA